MKVSVNQDLCIAAGRCVAVAPEVFDLDEDGFVVLISEEHPKELEDSVERAAMVCPARAIKLEG